MPLRHAESTLPSLRARTLWRRTCPAESVTSASLRSQNSTRRTDARAATVAMPLAAAVAVSHQYAAPPATRIGSSTAPDPSSPPPTRRNRRSVGLSGRKYTCDTWNQKASSERPSPSPPGEPRLAGSGLRHVGAVTACPGSGSRAAAPLSTHLRTVQPSLILTARGRSVTFTPRPCGIKPAQVEQAWVNPTTMAPVVGASGLVPSSCEVTACPAA